jgi:hypothetical protein
MFQAEVVGKTKAHGLFSVLFSPRKSCIFFSNVEIYGRDRQVTDVNIMLSRKDVICMPDN